MSATGEPTLGSPFARVELPGLAEDELARLADSIRTHKLLSPVIVSSGPACPGEIADGKARAEICAQLGIDCPHEPRPFATEEEFRRFRLITNLERRRLTDAQRIRIGLALLPYEREQAAARRAQAAGRPQGTKSVPVGLPEQTGEATAIVAHKVGLKPSTFARGAKVLEHGSPELIHAFDTDRETVNSAYRKLQAERRREARDRISRQLRESPPPLPEAIYDVVVSDPPWPYQHDKLPYPTQTLDEIAELPLPGLLADDAVVWLWTTNTFLPAAYQLLDRWGLKPRGVLT